MKEIKKEKVFQYTGKYIPEKVKRPHFFIDAFKRKTLYFVGDTFMIKNNFKYIDSFLRIHEIIYVGDYIVEDKEGIVHMIRKKEFENNYKIVD